MKADVIIIGGGLAGLTAGIHLAKSGLGVTVFEKNKFPKHKVCGEYISNEVLPYLGWLNADPGVLQPTEITHAQFSTTSGKLLEIALPLGGFGISRYALDKFLMKKALDSGVEIREDSVTDVQFEADNFTVFTNKGASAAKIVLGSFGKRSNLDIRWNRGFIQKKSPWLAVKAHYSGDFPNNLVALHNFKGGYCGISKVENDRINVCYLAAYDSFGKFKNIDNYQNEILSLNPHLKAIFKDLILLFEKPITISQVSFEQKEKVRDHILMIGDSAGLIHPLCGNGMAMAIHSAKIAAELILDYFAQTFPDRKVLEVKYLQEWDRQFKTRLKTGNLISAALRNEKVSEVLMSSMILFPSLLRRIIKYTHGQTITINNDKYQFQN